MRKTHQTKAKEKISKKKIFRILEYILALATCIVLIGVVFPNGDQIASFPWLSRLKNPRLFSNDIKFGSELNLYYQTYFRYLNFLSNFVPIHISIVIHAIITRLILIIALVKITEKITKKSTSPLLIAFLLASNQRIVGDYLLMSVTFGTHPFAYSLSLLSINYYLEDKKTKAAILIFIAFLFNPRIGVFGFCLLFLIWLWKTDKRKRTFAFIGLTACVFIFFFLLCIAWIGYIVHCIECCFIKEN